MEQYFALLGLQKGASEKEIKKAYVRQIRMHSPEKDPEGTAFTALMYRLLGDEVRAVESLNALRNIQTYRGMIPASTVDQLPTGLDLFDGSSWNYSNDPHVAPTAWFVMAVNGFNPYTF